MKNYRIGVFETNSSSTHSLTIRRITSQVGEIPKNEENYNICDNVALPYNESVFGEVQKLRYLVGLIAGRIDEAANNEDYFEGEYYTYWGNKSEEGFKKYKEEILNYPWLVWLNDIIKEKCGTTLYYYKNQTEFPYISETQRFEDDYSYELLGISKEDIYNEEKVKAIFEDIIFNPLVVLEDKDEEY